ncbi:dihydropteroate synthase [Paenibacillus thermoaerophilus]|uniref:Dihydropteroate synthase n=1 Tax=Paenibacillus thermoaerophilus TaxID=1215385 RepID=A0ABW2UYJ2_9BACL|nr:dihydropteroate synthase [Paenibacillus thermoaerophilus]TMV09434.1 dihydropteroate synthase [Paenibacillus thermoaerophilus]
MEIVRKQTVAREPITLISPHGRKLELGKRTVVMGILNVTPDSFSDGGKYAATDAAVRHAVEMAANGAGIIDVGGESTRPGAAAVPLKEELARVLPAIRAIRKELPDIPISVDTYKAEVARQAIEAGADLINDVWGGLADEDMPRVMASTGAWVCLMHNRKDGGAYSGDLIDEMVADLREMIARAIAAGVEPGNILLDPGIGFAKSYEQNLEAMSRLVELRQRLGYPLLLGTSRKRFIRRTLGDVAVDDCLEGTLATNILGIAAGCDIVRVHDVREMARAARMTDAIVRGATE